MTRFATHFSPTLRARFVAHNKDYVESVVHEAVLRSEGVILNEGDYRDLRRVNGAVVIFFDLIEVILGTELPEEVHKDDVFEQVYMAALDMIVYCNVSLILTSLSGILTRELCLRSHRTFCHTRWNVREVSPRAT